MELLHIHVPVIMCIFINVLSIGLVGHMNMYMYHLKLKLLVDHSKNM